MKTLDEVIKAWEFCPANPETCQGCPYQYDAGVGAENCYKDDALAWLKGYQTHIELDKLRDKHEAKNDPLTWDELRQMEGKPVWYEETNAYEGDSETIQTKHWDIIKKVYKSQITFYVQEMSSHKSWQGIGWQAYRKERK